MVGGFLHYLFTWVLVRLKAGVGGVVLIDRFTQIGSIFAMLVIYGAFLYLTCCTDISKKFVLQCQ